MAPHPGWMQGDHPSAPGPDTDPMIAGHPVGHYSAEGKLLMPLTKKQVKAVEKTLRGKVPKQTFPLNLRNPAHDVGFALSHRLYYG